MPEPVDLDARHRLGGHGARAHRRLMANCQLRPVHEPALSPTTASSSAGDRGSDVSSARHPGPGQRRRAGTRGPPRESRATWAPQREVSTASSQHHLVRGERECQARTNHRLSGWPAPVWRRGAKDWDNGTQPARPGVHVTATHTGPCPPPTDLTGAGDHMTGLTAEPIVPGSVRELAGVGDDHNALLPWTCRPRSTRRARRCREHRQDPDPRAASNGPTSTARCDPIGGSR